MVDKRAFTWVRDAPCERQHRREGSIWRYKRRPMGRMFLSQQKPKIGMVVDWMGFAGE